MSPPRLVLSIAWFCLQWVLLGAVLVWAFGALWYDFPLSGWRHPLAVVFVAGAGAVLVVVRPHKRAKLGVATALLLVMAWWFSLRPSNERNWQPDVSRTAWADVNGDTVTLHNLRNCDYRTESDYTPHWETRTVNLARLTGLDLAICYWGSPWMAHPILSFQFADGPPVAMSIETRKEVGETYSAIGGFYRQYELIFIAADERDVLRVRTNYRKGEDIYLYRTTTTPADARKLFMEYVKSINGLHAHPRWYNALTTNCTTAIRHQRPPGERAPFDWRILANGKMDELFYERHLLVTDGLPFAQLKNRALINPAAQAAGASPDFSRLIRLDRPGFTPAK